MQDLSLHLIDLIENSVRAEASSIAVRLTADASQNRLRMSVEDDGVGMDARTLSLAQGSLYTSKDASVGKTGRGIPGFKQNTLSSGGCFTMSSKPGLGTRVSVDLGFDQPGRMPLGKLEDTLLCSIVGHPEVDFDVRLSYLANGSEQSFVFDTAAIKAELGDVPLCHPDVIEYMAETLKKGIKNTNMEDV